MKQETTNFSLKDQLFNKEKVEYISGLIHESYPDFLEEDFITEVLEDFPNLELTQRISHITTVLRKYLPENFTESVTILLNSLPTVEENGSLDNNF